MEQVMEEEYKLHNRVYVPPSDELNADEYLLRYIEREFPDCKDGENKVYSIPGEFKKTGEKQATLAEQVVFRRLKAIGRATEFHGTWIMFFHNASYAGKSFRNQRFGKLMIREHDFVVFVRSQEKCYILLAEVKSTNDANTPIQNVVVTSDAKVIKNNKRSAQHQLRDHIEIIEGVLGKNAKKIQTYIMWPFLGALTRDPKQAVMKRWKEDNNLHVFEDVLSKQELFNRWFLDNILSSQGIGKKHFMVLLKRFIILSCGVFVDEIYRGLLALLTQEQLELLDNDYCQRSNGRPLVVHGAAGTGKTLLVLRKLEQLYHSGRLDENNRALYICYWPGIRFEVQSKLKSLGISDYVDTARFFISQNSFLQQNKAKYKHIFMDEAEAICLAFDNQIATNTISRIFQKYHSGNCPVENCSFRYVEEYDGANVGSVNEEHTSSSPRWGDLWFLVDINQAALFLPKHSPSILKKPNVLLTKVMRSTGNIFNIVKEYYSNPMPLMPKQIFEKINIPSISVGHHLSGPPVFWVDCEVENDSQKGIQNALVNVIIDLCATKGFKPNDLCVIPFLISDLFAPNSINEKIQQHFVENGYRPRGVGEVEMFLEKREVNDFLISWALKVKGLEFKVVIMAFDEDDFDQCDFEDRKKTYIIASRCTCMLVIVSSRAIRDAIDVGNVIIQYQFDVSLQ